MLFKATGPSVGLTLPAVLLRVFRNYPISENGSESISRMVGASKKN